MQNITHWVDGIEILVPQVYNFNSFDLDNAGFIADWTNYDGYYYLIYAGNTEK